MAGADWENEMLENGMVRSAERDYFALLEPEPVKRPIVVINRPPRITARQIHDKAATWGTLKAQAAGSGFWNRADLCGAELLQMVDDFGRQCADSGEVGL